VASADLSRLDLVRQELEKLLLQERLAGGTLLVWANKQDIEGILPPEKIAESLRRPGGWPISESPLVHPRL
jgi:ADP-ribosylation factor-like protein 2